MAVRFRVGVAHVDGKWYCLAVIGDNEQRLSEPFATEAEADARAAEVSAAVRSRMSEVNASVVDGPDIGKTFGIHPSHNKEHTT